MSRIGSSYFIAGLYRGLLATTLVIRDNSFLWRGADHLPWPIMARTPVGMSMVSIVAMQMAKDIVDSHLTGGQVSLEDRQFWMAVVSIRSWICPVAIPYHGLHLLQV